MSADLGNPVLSRRPGPARYAASMARIPLEDNFDDVINKAQRGLRITDADLAQRAEVSAEDLAAVKSGQPIDAVLRRVARHLRLSATASKPWPPRPRRVGTSISIRM